MAGTWGSFRLKEFLLPKLVGSPLTVLTFFLLVFTSHAYADYDIRVLNGFDTSAQLADYVFSISDCYTVDHVDVSAGSFQQTFLPDYDTSTGNCIIPFTGKDAGYLTPSATITKKSGVQESYSETFTPESNLPEIALGAISITTIENQKFLSLNCSINFLAIGYFWSMTLDLFSCSRSIFLSE